MEENIFLHFASPTPFYLYINGEYIDSVDNKTDFFIDMQTSTRSFIFSYFPISKNTSFLPYTQTMEFEGSCPKCISDDVDIVPYNSNHYDIILNPIEYKKPKQMEVLLEENIDKCFVAISNSIVGNIMIYENNHLRINTTTPEIISATIKSISNKMLIKCALKNNSFYILVVNINNLEVLMEEVCHSWEMEKNKIKALTKLNDLAGHGRVFSIDLNSGETERYTIYMAGGARTTTSRELIPLAFLEALRIENFKLAKEYLSEKFSQVSDLHFKNYFGEIQGIYFNRHTDNNKFVNYTIKSSSYKNYNFDVWEGKIQDIKLS